MSCQSAKRFTRYAFAFSSSWLAVCGATATRAADAEAVTIDTTFIVKTPPVRLDQPARRSTGQRHADDRRQRPAQPGSTGTMIDSTGNFLIRSADLFLRHGLNVMMAERPPRTRRGSVRAFA